MSSRLLVRSGHFSDKGVKEGNDDACGVLTPDEPANTTKGVACIVSDGVSSSEGGKEAAQACVQGFLNDYYSTPDSWTVKTSGQCVLGALNRWLHGQGHTHYGNAHGMLTTASALVIKSATAHLFHVGDSRIYHCRAGELECLTRDHQTWTSTEKAFLNRALGADVSVEIDYRKLAAEEGDLFVLVTDGVHAYVPLKEFQEVLLMHAKAPERAARELVTRALENGSRDNVTCLVLRVEQLPLPEQDEFYQHLTELPFPPPLEANMIIDGYRILRELHASKRTQVYLAQDAEDKSKIVLKTPSVNYEDDASYIERFLQEEWAGRRVRNTHVLKVLKPKNRRRFLYYLTEYIEGKTLRQWMYEHPRPQPVQVVPLIEQIIRGLRAFHRLEMLHQDIKPENIMLDEHDTVKIVDFGSVKIAGIQEIATPLPRQHVLGTLDYSAPEYFQGSTGTLRSDLYSLAAVCYEMFTGHLPYGKAFNEHNISKLDYVPLHRHRPDLPVWLDKVLHKALEKNPDRRYGLLSEFLYELERPGPHLLRGKPEPILERNPAVFWRVLAIGSLVLNLLLVFWLTH